MVRQTLLAMSIALCTCMSLIFSLAGFVPQDVGYEMRRFARQEIVRLDREDMPAPIQSAGDGHYFWAFRGMASLEEPIDTGDGAQHSAIRFNEQKVVITLGEDDYPFGRHDIQFSFVPLDSSDGVSLPGLLGSLPFLYADILDGTGTPLRWHSDKTLQNGFTPLQLRRVPWYEADYEENDGLHDGTTERRSAYKAKGSRGKKRTRSGDSEDVAEFRGESPSIARRMRTRFLIRPQGEGLLRALAYQPLVRLFSRRFGLDPTLVNAIIFNESYFRETLVSRRNAVGLMQVLPQTARDDIHAFLYGTQGAVTRGDLFDPELNIQYGTAYLSLLMNRYFADVKNKDSREYCTIAAYNMGPGRVLRIFGDTLAEAAAKMNTLTDEEVYQTLLERLQFAETRNYLIKVRSLKQQYAVLGLR